MLIVVLSLFLVVVLGAADVLMQYGLHSAAKAVYTEWKNRVNYLEYERKRVRELNKAMQEK